MERIGIYGGSFNPPHIGHIEAAKQAVARLQLDRLLMVPAGVVPHKVLPANSPTALQRLQMLRIATADCPNLEVSDVELCREGVSYTWQTVQALRQHYPDAKLILIMGTDMFLSFHTWKNPAQIIQNASLGVFYRGQRDEVAAVEKQKLFLEKQGAKVYLVDNPVTEISSTDLRRLLNFRCADEFLDPAVTDFIRQNRLYGTDRALIGLSLEELEKTVVSLLKPNRVAHVLGCRDTAVELARRWGADENDAARAALLHDITKALDGPLQLTLCHAYGIILDHFAAHNPKTLHALTGSYVAQRIFGENAAVVSAIASHTTGKANMNVLEKIIYVADYMEPNRDFPGVDELRDLARTDLDKALKTGLEMTLAMLRQQGKEISPESLEALAWLETSNI